MKHIPRASAQTVIKEYGAVILAIPGVNSLKVDFNNKVEETILVYCTASELVSGSVPEYIDHVRLKLKLSPPKGL